MKKKKGRKCFFYQKLQRKCHILRFRNKKCVSRRKARKKKEKERDRERGAFQPRHPTTFSVGSYLHLRLLLKWLYRTVLLDKTILTLTWKITQGIKILKDKSVIRLVSAFCNENVSALDNSVVLGQTMSNPSASTPQNRDKNNVKEQIEMTLKIDNLRRVSRPRCNYSSRTLQVQWL